MGLESLEPVELLNVSFGLIFVLISIIIVVRIFINYLKYREINFLLIGIVWLFLSSPWWGNAISFFTWMLYEKELDVFLDLFLGNIFVPFALVAWVYIITSFIYKEKRKIIIAFYSVVCGIYEVLLLIFFAIDYRIIGRSTDRFNTEHELFPFIFQIFAILTALITGILFAKESMKSKEPKLIWKGRFLLIAFVSFSVSATFDAAIPMTAITLVIIRTILTTSAIEYYLGFFIPDKIVDFLSRR
ncbi:MAG: hypothetical protein GF317_10360 [Candidatus Lokiarchaeota archaeon]|nr:hypothetical protein [Candidatus Lokiarchaeota archaeon]MBD3200056.1 hypothetical protein [Candidatus Lokiarchaeota archaeon]